MFSQKKYSTDAFKTTTKNENLISSKTTEYQKNNNENNIQRLNIAISIAMKIGFYFLFNV